MFDAVLAQITLIANDLWTFLIGLIIIVAGLGTLYFVLQGATGAAFGGSRMAQSAVVGIAGLAILVMVGFLVVPELNTMLTGLVPPSPFGGP